MASAEHWQKGTPERRAPLLPPRKPEDCETTDVKSGHRRRMGFPESRLKPGRRSKFQAIGSYDAFRLPRSRHIEEAKQQPLSRQAARSIDTHVSPNFSRFNRRSNPRLAFAAALAWTVPLRPSGKASGESRTIRRRERGHDKDWEALAIGELRRLGVFVAQGENSKTCYALATPKDRAPPD